MATVALIAYGVTEDRRADEIVGPSATTLAMVAGTLLTAGTTGIGALLGAAAPAERWRTVGRDTRVAVSLLPVGGGGGLALSVPLPRLAPAARRR